MMRAVVSLWAVVTLVFAVSHAIPSDPARILAGPQARPQDVLRLRQQLALDQGIMAQYTTFWQRLLHRPSSTAGGETHASCMRFSLVHIDLGMSYPQRRPVTALLAERAPRTLLLALVAVTIQGILGIVWGAMAVVRRKRTLALLPLVASLVLVSTPTFLLGFGLQWLFARNLRWLPLDGVGHSLLDNARSLVLPALTLGLFGAAYTGRLVHRTLSEALTKDFARTALAKGASQRRVVFHHALASILLPIVTAMAMDLGALMSGAAVTEKLFRWPGLGSLALGAVAERDQPLLLGTVLLSAVGIVVCNLVVDLASPRLDPRLRGAPPKP
jgi:peptide/nickel transport system permease protein